MKEKIRRNYLDIKSVNELVQAEKPLETLFIEKINPPNFQLNKFFYKEIGKKHHWKDRLMWNDKDWIKYLNSKGKSTYILKENNNLVGFFEQYFMKKIWIVKLHILEF